MRGHPIEDTYRWLAGDSVRKFNDVISRATRREVQPSVLVKIRVTTVNKGSLDIRQSLTGRYSKLKEVESWKRRREY